MSFNEFWQMTPKEFSWRAKREEHKNDHDFRVALVAADHVGDYALAFASKEFDLKRAPDKYPQIFGGIQSAGKQVDTMPDYKKAASLLPHKEEFDLIMSCEDQEEKEFRRQRLQGVLRSDIKRGLKYEGIDLKKMLEDLNG